MEEEAKEEGELEGPQGEPREPGIQGEQGEPGIQGPTQYVDVFVSQAEFTALQTELAALQEALDALASGQTGGGTIPTRLLSMKCIP